MFKNPTGDTLRQSNIWNMEKIGIIILAIVFFTVMLRILKSTLSYDGGVISCNQLFDTYSFASLLDYLVHQSLVMLLYSELRNPNEDLLHEYTRLLEKKKKSTDRYTKELANEQKNKI